MSEQPDVGQDGTPDTASAASAANPRTSMQQARRRARELALQGIYQWLLAGTSSTTIKHHLQAENDDFASCDQDLLTTLLAGVINNADALRGHFEPMLSRPVSELSPIEHAVLLIGSHELCHSLDTPYRVIINEAIELAKAYGGTDGHKFVNGVLDRTAARLRADEVKATRRR